MTTTAEITTPATTEAVVPTEKKLDPDILALLQTEMDRQAEAEKARREEEMAQPGADEERYASAGTDKQGNPLILRPFLDIPEGKHAGQYKVKVAGGSNEIGHYELVRSFVIDATKAQAKEGTQEVIGSTTSQ